MSSRAIQTSRGQEPLAPFRIIKESATLTSDACVVTLKAEIQGTSYTFIGSSRRAPGDRSDKSVGHMVALGRAYTQLANKLTSRASGMVRHHDNVQAHQEAIRAAANPRPVKKAPKKAVAKPRAAKKVAKKVSKKKK